MLVRHVFVSYDLIGLKICHLHLKTVFSVPSVVVPPLYEWVLLCFSSALKSLNKWLFSEVGWRMVFMATMARSSFLDSFNNRILKPPGIAHGSWLINSPGLFAYRVLLRCTWIRVALLFSYREVASWYSRQIHGWVGARLMHWLVSVRFCH